jgi:hypothetical protein
MAQPRDPGREKWIGEKRWSKELRRRRTHEERLAAYTGRSLYVAAQRRETRPDRWANTAFITPPTRLNFIDETPGFLSFLDDLYHARREGKDIYIDLSKVESITPDALAILLSTMDRPMFRRTDISGNLPEAAEARQVVKRSGFFRHVGMSQQLRQEGGSDTSYGILRNKARRFTDGRVAKELIHFATRNLYGSTRRCASIYATLVECMNNTFEHAPKHEHVTETWWAAVYFDKKKGRAVFTFIDTGVGIFESLRKRKLLTPLLRILKMGRNAELMRELLAGGVASRTGLSYRGKGLPTMKEDLQLGGFSRLIIISNDVHADVEADRYTPLKQSFRGTFLSWELRGPNYEDASD